MITSLKMRMLHLEIDSHLDFNFCCDPHRLNLQADTITIIGSYMYFYIQTQKIFSDFLTKNSCTHYLTAHFFIQCYF